MLPPILVCARHRLHRRGLRPGTVHVAGRDERLNVIFVRVGWGDTLKYPRAAAGGGAVDAREEGDVSGEALDGVNRERVRLGVKDVVALIDRVVLVEKKVEVFEGLGEKEARHLVLQRTKRFEGRRRRSVFTRRPLGHVRHRGMAALDPGSLKALDHTTPLPHPPLVACRAVHKVGALGKFRAERVPPLAVLVGRSEGE